MRDRYAFAREFVPLGRLMFLRPIKPAANVEKARRGYEPVWIPPQVGTAAAAQTKCTLPSESYSEVVHLPQPDGELKHTAACLWAGFSQGGHPSVAPHDGRPLP